MNNIQSTVSRLQKKQYVASKDYAKLYTVCRKVASKIYRQYKLQDIVYKPNIQEDILEDITVTSLAKALKTYDPDKKAKFLSYYYNKARSNARVHQRKCYKRQFILNAHSIEAFEERFNED